MTLRQDFDALFVPVYNPASFIPERGQGSRVWDTDGREYVDFAGGIAVSSLGHGHTALLEALTGQAQKLWHLSNAYTNVPAIELAKKLTERTFAELVFFSNSGAEANEAALKLARKYGSSIRPEKTTIISFKKSFHGRTLFTVSVGGQEKYSKAFAPLPAGIEHATFNELESVKALIDDNTCAVIVEPIQGEGGIIPAQSEFLHGLRALCDEFDALLIFDEVQTGVGRTGHLYAYMDTGVIPDVLTTAKALGGGFPIGAMLCNKKAGTLLVVGDHGTTYGGNPLACAVAGSVLDVIDEAVLQGVQEKQRYFTNQLNALNAKYGLFEGVRGKGLLLGLPLKPEYAGRAKELVTLAGDKGLMCLVAGPDVVRFTPSLLIDNKDIDEGLARFEQALQSFLGTDGQAG